MLYKLKYWLPFFIPETEETRETSGQTEVEETSLRQDVNMDMDSSELVNGHHSNSYEMEEHSSLQTFPGEPLGLAHGQDLEVPETTSLVTGKSHLYI